MKSWRKFCAAAFLSAAFLGALGACGNEGNEAAPEPAEEAAEETQPEAAAPVETAEFSGRDFLNWFYEYGQWRTLENASPITGHPGGFVTDASGRPSAEDLELILNTASLAVTSGGRSDWYMVVVEDTDAQNEIIGKIEGQARATSDGTVTVLMFSERLIREDLRTDEVVGFAPDRGYYNVGIVTGYLNMAAVALGYGTRMFMTPAIPGNGFHGGERWLEAEHFLDGRYYVMGSTGETFSAENMKFVNAVVIGSPAEVDPDLDIDVDVVSHATTRQFPHNWSIWDPANATGPIIPVVEDDEVEETAAQVELVLEDGVFTGSAYGFFSQPLVVEVEVDGGVIVSIEVLEHGETEEYFIRASEGFGNILGMIPQILESQSLELDAVSGATATSDAILEAVADALGF